MNSPTEVDIVIVGGGPAGLATALALVRQDAAWAERMVVLERAAHPRPKLCAGGITRFGLAQLRRLGLSLEVPFVLVREARFRLGHRVIRVRGRPIFVVTRREEFDHWLARQARAAGVRLIESQQVESLQRDGGGVVVRTSSRAYRAQAVVGADGSRGLVRRWVVGHERPARVARLLEVVTPARGSEPEYAERFALFDFTPIRRELQGYTWDFPSLIAGRPFLNRGVYDARLDASRPRAGLRQILEEHLGARGADPRGVDLAGHPLHWFTPFNRLRAPRALLVGDAAGAEPLFGEGIGPALGFAQPAAAALRRAFHKQDFSLDDYPRRLFFSPVGRYLLLRWLGAEVAYRLSGYPALIRGLWEALALLARVVGEARAPVDLPTRGEVASR
jgi:flavin-dependent dehydrogenase